MTELAPHGGAAADCIDGRAVIVPADGGGAGAGAPPSLGVCACCCERKLVMLP